METTSLNTQIKVTARTDVGKVREHNEDNYIVCPDLAKPDWFITNTMVTMSEKGSLLVIADGMGGLNAGEVASTLVIDSVQTYFKREDLSLQNQGDIKEALLQSLKGAQANLVAHAKENIQTRGMGTTIVVALVQDSLLHVAWVGDSRCYVFRNSIELYFATKDHSLVQELVDSGKITQDQAFFHPESNVISRSLGDHTSATNQADFCSFPLQEGDRILLCTDGLNGMLQDKVIATILHQEKDITVCADQLIEQANRNGGHDNITIILYDVISLNPKEMTEDLKLYQLQLAASYEPLQPTASPFPTLQPIAEPLQDKTKSITVKKHRKGLLTIGLIVMIGLFAAFSQWYKKGSQANVLPNKKVDTLKKKPHPIEKMVKGLDSLKNSKVPIETIQDDKKPKVTTKNKPDSNKAKKDTHSILNKNKSKAVKLTDLSDSSTSKSN